MRGNALERICPLARRSKKAVAYYAPIHADDRPWQRQWLNNVKCFWLHVNRVCEQPGVAKCATESEKAYMTRAMTGKLIEASTLLGYMAWRRSAMFLLVVLSAGLIAASFPFELLTDGWPDVPRMDITYQQWKDTRMTTRDCHEVDVVFDEMLSPLVLEAAGAEQGVVYREGALTSCEQLVASGTKEQVCESTLTELFAERVVTVETYALFCGAFVPWCACRTPLRIACPTACGDGAPSGVHCESHVEYCRDTGFASYTEFWWQEASQAILGQFSRVRIIYKLYSLPVNIMIITAAACAANSWSSWARSSRFIGAANVFALLSPLLFSIIPTSSYFDHDSFERGVDAFQESIASLSSVPDAHETLTLDASQVGLAWTTCSQTYPDSVNHWGQLKGEVVSHCNSATDNLCRTADVSVPIVDTGLSDLTSVCGVVHAYFDTHDASVFKDELESASHTVEVILKLFSGLGLAGMSMMRLWPVAFSLSPALISGSTMAKIMVPQASLPGTFIILLPILQVPMSWCLGSAIVEVVWSMYGPFTLMLMVGLFLVNFEPLAKSIIGVRFKLNVPMDQETALSIISRGKVVSRTVQLVAVCFICIFFFVVKADLSDKVNSAAAALNGGVHSGDELLVQVLQTSLQPSVILAFCVNFGVRFLLVQITSLDTIISIAANERKFESMKKRQEELENHFGGTNLKRLQYYRNKNLDLLVDLVGLGGEDTGDAQSKKPVGQQEREKVDGSEMQRVPSTILPSKLEPLEDASEKKEDGGGTDPGSVKAFIAELFDSDTDEQKSERDRTPILARFSPRGERNRDQARDKEKDRNRNQGPDKDQDKDKEGRQKDKKGREREKEPRQRDKNSRERDKDARDLYKEGREGKERDKVRDKRDKEGKERDREGRERDKEGKERDKDNKYRDKEVRDRDQKVLDRDEASRGKANGDKFVDLEVDRFDDWNLEIIVPVSDSDGKRENKNGMTNKIRDKDRDKTADRSKDSDKLSGNEGEKKRRREPLPKAKTLPEQPQLKKVALSPADKKSDGTKLKEKKKKEVDTWSGSSNTPDVESSFS